MDPTGAKHRTLRSGAWIGWGCAKHCFLTAGERLPSIHRSWLCLVRQARGRGVAGFVEIRSFGVTDAERLAHEITSHPSLRPASHNITGSRKAGVTTPRVQVSGYKARDGRHAPLAAPPEDPVARTSFSFPGELRVIGRVSAAAASVRLAGLSGSGCTAGASRPVPAVGAVSLRAANLGTGQGVGRRCCRRWLSLSSLLGPRLGGSCCTSMLGCCLPRASAARWQPFSSLRPALARLAADNRVPQWPAGGVAAAIACRSRGWAAASRAPRWLAGGRVLRPLAFAREAGLLPPRASVACWQPCLLPSPHARVAGLLSQARLAGSLAAVSFARSALA